MHEFNYHRPSDIPEAKGLLEKAKSGLYLAGGHTLIPSLKQRLSAPTDVIDLAGIETLKGISVEDAGIRIGALTTHAEVADSDLVRKHAPVLCTLAQGIGDAQVRHRGTLGGSIANNDPAADYPAAVLGLGATIHTDQRAIAAEDFIVDMFETALVEAELITAVSFPKTDTAGYAKFANQASRYATVGVMLVRQKAGVRVAITGAAPCAFRMTEFEEALSADFSVAALEGLQQDSSSLLSDMHASAEYRAHLCGVLVKKLVASLS